MILQQNIVNQLREKWSRFTDFEDAYRIEAKSYSEAMSQLIKMSSDEICSRLDQVETPGAIPTDEHDAASEFCIEFRHTFNNHQESRAWALDQLLDHITFAVDGSQIRQDSDFSVPIAAVQVAWFENHHTRDGKYLKDQQFEILTPDELIIEFDGDRVISEQVVNTRRFEMETDALCNLMREIDKQRTSKTPLPVALFDSSLVISFADRLQDEMRKRHIASMLKLLRCSRETKIPLVGYVDNSHARDLTNMLAVIFSDLAEAKRINDALLVNRLQGWGSRTPFMVCARGGADLKKKGILADFEEYERGIGFTYLNTTSSNPPARLEIPVWVRDDGLLDEVLDIVRAEVIIGNGYPYVIESADAAAVISHRDREAFYALFQKFAEEQGFRTRISQKLTSKFRRR